MQLEITKINPGPLTNTVKKLLLMVQSVYLNLTDDTIFSNSYLPTKDVAKIVITPTSEIFEFEQLYFIHSHCSIIKFVVILQK